MKNAKHQVVASVFVYRVEDMHPKGLKTICNWLRAQANAIQANPKAFAKVFRARCYCLVPKEAKHAKK